MCARSHYKGLAVTGRFFNFFQGKSVKTFNTSAKLLVGAALVASGGMASAVNLVTNGSFELGTDAPTSGAGNNAKLLNYFLPTSTYITGWTVVGSGSDKVGWLYGVAGDPFPPALVAQDQSRFIDLTGTSFGGPFGGMQTQIFTTLNQQYKIEYYLGTSNNYNYTPNAPAAAILTIAGALFDVQQNATDLPNSWLYKSATFIAQGPTTTVTFLGWVGDDYIGLDNVSITAVPEPSSIAMLLAGVAAVGTVVARKRKQIS